MHVVDKKKRDIHVWLKIKNTFEVKVTITFFWGKDTLRSKYMFVIKN